MPARFRTPSSGAAGRPAAQGLSLTLAVCWNWSVVMFCVSLREKVVALGVALKDHRAALRAAVDVAHARPEHLESSRAQFLHSPSRTSR